MKTLATLVLCCSILGACEPPAPAGADEPADAAPAAEDPSASHAAVPLTAMQENGRLIYETTCWTCHGPDGRGNGPAVAAGAVPAPPSFHGEAYATASLATLEARFHGALDGEDERHPHMQYVISLLKPERFRDALSFVPALVYPSEIPGSAIAGKTMYDHRCVACHGIDGRGNGPGAHLLVEMPPADFTTDTLIAARDWPAVYQRIREGGGTVHGSSMPPWGISLTQGETWNLVAYLATFQPAVLSEPAWMD